MNQGFSTSEVAPASRLSHWRRMINETFVPLDVTPIGGNDGFAGAVSISEVGELRIARVTARPMAASHSTGHIDSSADNDYFLALHLRGIAHARQDGRNATLHAGDFALLDSTRPYAIEFRGDEHFEHLIYRVPRAALDVRWGEAQSATARTVALASNEGRLTASYLHALTNLAAPLTANSAERMSAAALDLLAAALSTTTRSSTLRGASSPSLAGRVKQRALAGIADPGLSPASVAEASFVSVRQLHRVFAAEGTTFGAFLREERLRRCRQDLSDPSLAREPIAAIAARWGCRSPAHFTRIFTARYGVTPRAFRRTAGAGRAPRTK